MVDHSPWLSCHTDNSMHVDQLHEFFDTHFIKSLTSEWLTLRNRLITDVGILQTCCCFYRHRLYPPRSQQTIRCRYYPYYPYHTYYYLYYPYYYPMIVARMRVCMSQLYSPTHHHSGCYHQSSISHFYSSTEETRCMTTIRPNIQSVRPLQGPRVNGRRTTHRLYRFLSAYREYHSKETASTQVLWDLFSAIGGGNITLISLLDMSAAPSHSFWCHQDLPFHLLTDDSQFQGFCQSSADDKARLRHALTVCISGVANWSSTHQRRS